MNLHTKVGLFALAAFAVPVLAQDPAMRQEGRWAHEYTGRQADPRVLFGTLPNGLRYAIMRNATPADGVSMRLRIGSGSIEEDEDQQGYAHFLEHMAFRGSKRIPDGEAVRMLERHGLRLGPDTNAFTAQDQTVYMFNFPKADAASLDTGLNLFREIGQNLTLDAAPVEAERGVVLSEERARDVPAYRMTKANLGNALAGTRAVERWPIGKIETIKSVSPERLRAFYRAHYRPDNATVIIVGNVDPRAVEGQIRARFGDWKAAGAMQRADPGAPRPASPASEFISEGAPEGLFLNWVRPVDRRADTLDVEREQVLQVLGSIILQVRLNARANQPGSPLIGGQATIQPDVVNSAALTQISIGAAPEKWREALAATIEEQRQLVEGGIPPEELARASTILQTIVQAAIDGVSARTHEQLADALVKSVDEDQVFTSPEQDKALLGEMLAKLAPDDVQAALRLAFSGAGPTVFRTSQGAPVGSEALAAAVSQGAAATLAERAGQSAVVWPYTDFGPAGVVVSKTQDAELGATVVTFANGSRLIVKPTGFEKDRVYVDVALGNGRAGVRPDLKHALWTTQLAAIGGTGKLSASDIGRWADANGKLIGMQVQADSRAFSLKGQTRPRDLLDQLQLLAAFSRDAGFRPELGEKLQAIATTLAGQIDATPGTVFEREVQRLFGGGDTRYSDVPAKEDLAATRPGDPAALLRPELDGPADVTIVGDIDVAAAIKAVGLTFAAGPARARPAASGVRLHMPKGSAEPHVFLHKGRGDQAVYGAVWALPDYYTNPRLSHVAQVAANVISGRLVDNVRETLGLTYAPNVAALSSIQLPGLGYFRAAIETPASNFEAFQTILNAEVADLAKTPVSADELSRSVTPLREARQKQMESNQWWAANLPTLWREPRARGALLDEAKGVGTVTAADVQAFARDFLLGTKPTVILVKAQ